MRPVIACFCLVSLVAAAEAPGADADIRILHYDGSGRVDGVDRLVPENGHDEAWPALAGSAQARFEPGEVLVFDPSETLRRQLGQFDLSVIEEVRLPALDMTLLQLRVPAASTVADAIGLLGQRLPGTVADANYLYEPALGTVAGEALPASWVRSVIGWPAADDRCGDGLRIGIIDASVDTHHPALIGRKVEFRSFHGRDRRPAAADHGTAVAAILVGRPSDEGWCGILPGADLKAANMIEYNELGAAGRQCGRASEGTGLDGPGTRPGREPQHGGAGQQGAAVRARTRAQDGSDPGGGCRQLGPGRTTGLPGRL